MKITSRYYYDHKHQRWVIEHKVSQYYPLDTAKDVLLSIESATEAYLRAGLSPDA